MSELPDADRLVASAVNYLIQGDEHEAATVLLLCDAEFYHEDWSTYCVNLVGPRAAHEILRDNEHPITRAIALAFSAVFPHGFDFGSINSRAQLLDALDPNWREELKQIAAGRGVHNQAVEIPNRQQVRWENLGFRSESERRVARALDAAGVLFLPNCLARLGAREHRATREADFLVCHEGKWGVLEVDGPFHPRAVVDHERDRLFKQHGIRVTERFDSQDCYSDAPAVVQKFLTLLARNG